MQSEIYFFTYGTLMFSSGHPLAQHVRSRTILKGKAYFPGLLFDLVQYPGAVYLPGIQYHVHGDLFLLDATQSDLFWDALDAYEGLTDDPFLTPYIREKIPVCFDNKIIEAFTYLYNQSLYGLPIIYSGRWDDRIPEP